MFRIPKLRDLTGMRFGRLVVLHRVKSTSSKARWLCQCDCSVDSKIEVNGDNLIVGDTQSCKCLRKEKIANTLTTHGMRGTKLYSIWNNMKNRCSNMNTDSYQNYGERGISVCKEWEESFDNFLTWSLANGYNNNLSLDRIDNDKGYNPNNCRWATMKEQGNNRRNNINITINDKTQTQSQWEEEFDLKQGTICRRLKLGWDNSEITIPVGSKRTIYNVKNT